MDSQTERKRGKRDNMFLKNGNWVLDYRLPNGKRKREKIGQSKKLAEIILKKRKVEIAEGKYLDIDKAKKVKLGEFINIFIENYCKPNKITWHDDLTRLTGLAQFLGKDMYLNDISSYNIEQFKKHRLQEGSKPSTVNRYLTIAKTMFNKAIEWDNIKENPLRKIKFFKENNERVRFLEKEEIRRLLEVSEGYLRDALIAALNTGTRYSELFNLKWSDVDFRRNLISIYKTKNKEKRVIPMNSLLMRTLLNIKERSASEYVFPNKNVRLPFEKALKRAKISNFRWHDLRHSFASHLVMNGIDLVTIKELLGHKTIKMTLRYSHLSQDHKARAVEVLGERLDTFRTLEPEVEKVERAVNLLTI